jgi:16S rRNA (guanine527-N7)-methyltransferase
MKAEERERLIAGAAALGLSLPADAPERLLAYRDLLQKWNATYNLTALKDPAQMISQHLLDSLAILPWVNAPHILDVGSGAGLPGIVLAIARPELAVTLVDAVQKKTAFQQQAIIELGLKGVTAHHARIEKLAGRYPCIVARAFAGLADFVALTEHLLAPGGRWLAMKGQRPDAELAALPNDIAVTEVIPLQVPELAAERHLILLERR